MDRLNINSIRKKLIDLFFIHVLTDHIFASQSRHEVADVTINGQENVYVACN